MSGAERTLTCFAVKPFDHARILAAFMLGGSSLVFGYSAPGHRFVGALAEDILKIESRSPDQAEARRARETLERARSLLHGLTFAQASVIPDEIKAWDPNGKFSADPGALVEEKHWPRALAADLRRYFKANSDPASGRNHDNYHYVDIPVTPWARGTYAPGAVGTERYDIVTTLHACEEILRGGGRGGDGRVIPEDVALVLMIHLVGDLHQPLHVGAEYFDARGEPVIPTKADLESGRVKSDIGGNSLEVSSSLTPPYDGRPGNLHYVWDGEIPKRAFEAWQASLGSDTDRPEALAGLLANRAAPSGYKPAGYDPSDLMPVWEAWANEILPVAEQAHAPFVTPVHPLEAKSPKIFSGELELKDRREDYDRVEAPVVQAELLKAGWRLAWVMKTVLAPAAN